MFVLEKDEPLHFCVDYRIVDFMTVRDLYQILIIDELIRPSENAVVYSALDAYAGCWQVEMDYAARYRTGSTFLMYRTALCASRLD